MNTGSLTDQAVNIAAGRDRSPAAARGRARPVPPMRPGEQLVWQGVPSWWSVARRVYHVQLVAAYFIGLTFIDMIITRTYEGTGWPVIQAAAPTVITGGICLGILLVLSWATQRTTTYTLTTRCVVMKFGVALPVTLVIPLHKIVGCAVRVRGKEGGDVSLRLVPGQEIPYHKLWPHARPWRLRAAEPMLRDLPDAAVMGPLLSRMLAARAQADAGLVEAAVPTKGVATTGTAVVKAATMRTRIAVPDTISADNLLSRTRDTQGNVATPANNAVPAE